MDELTNALRAAVPPRTVPVVEIFGPVIQGEGALAGLPTHFVRFGLCDFRCSWCDSMFAVLPELVKEHGERLTDDEICDRVLRLGEARWVTLSGGNPAIHELTNLVDKLSDRGYQVAVETQASKWREWLSLVDHLVCSPKPPSSGMTSAEHWEETRNFLIDANASCASYRRSLKIVVFNDHDLMWAREVFAWTRKQGQEWQKFLSVGTVQPSAYAEDYLAEYHSRIDRVREQVGNSYRWLCDEVAGRPDLVDVRVLPQLHVIAYGHKRGV